MPSPRSEKLHPPLELILEAGSAVGHSDSDLLELLLRGRDGSQDLAFRALLDRHGAMVWGVCRQLLGQAHDADDAFQATFLVLIRKAGSLKVTGSLGPWLYQVACAWLIRRDHVDAGSCLAGTNNSTMCNNPGMNDRFRRMISPNFTGS